MRLAYKLLIVSVFLLVTSSGFAAKHSELDQRLESLKSDFIKFSRQSPAPMHAAKDRILLGFTEKTSVSLSSVSISLNGKKLLQHNYIDTENQSLRAGGLQPLLELDLPQGRHKVLVRYMGNTPDGKTFDQVGSVSVSKSSSKKIIELTVSNKSNSTPSLSKQEH